MDDMHSIQMEIIAPKGKMRLFQHKPIELVSSPGTFRIMYQTVQCRAIRAFMKEHKND